MRLVGAHLLSGGRDHGTVDVRVADGRIVEVVAHDAGDPRAEDLAAGDGPVVDASELVLAPGLVDVHVHGAMGHDALDASSAALTAIAEHLARHGVTSYAPTTASHHRQAIDDAIAAHRAHRPGPTEARSVGLHLEGPYLATARCGAQDTAHLRDADPAEWTPWLASGQLALLTLAPERDPEGALVRAAVAAGVQVAVGHSDADHATTLRAIEAGVRQATHLFNGMPPLHHREPGVVGACLADPRVRVQLIPDLVHLHPAVLRIVQAAVGPERVILVSDAIRATGLADGDYLLGEQTVTVRDRVARTAVGGLAGSTLELLAGVVHHRWAAGVDLPTALHTASGVPAAALGCTDRGAVREGAAADLILLDPLTLGREPTTTPATSTTVTDLRPQLTVVAGAIAHDDLPDERWIRR